MKNNFLIYVDNLHAMKRFYQNVFDFTVIEILYSQKNSNQIRLQRENTELVLIEGSETISNENRIKPIFIIDEDIAIYRAKAIKYGGSFSVKQKEWKYLSYQVCNGTDIEGNVFEVRVKSRMIKK